MGEDFLIKIKYLFDKDYDATYANGVYGGATPAGDLAMHFYFERTPIPYEIEQKINEDGTMSDEDPVVLKPEDYKVIRHINTGVVLRPDVAIEICKWMQAQLIEMGVDKNELFDSDDSESHDTE